MRPVSSGYDAVNGCVIDIEDSRYHASFHSSRVQSYYFKNFFVAQFCLVMFFSAGMFMSKYAIGVKHIFGLVRPFQIVWEIVKFISVFVVDLWFSFWRWADECFRNKFVDNFGVFVGIFIKSACAIPPSVYFYNYKTWRFASNGNLSPHSSQIGNAIQSLVTFNWTPFLLRCINNVGHKLSSLTISVCDLATRETPIPRVVNFNLIQLLTPSKNG